MQVRVVDVDCVDEYVWIATMVLKSTVNRQSNIYNACLLTKKRVNWHDASLLRFFFSGWMTAHIADMEGINGIQGVPAVFVVFIGNRYCVVCPRSRGWEILKPPMVDVKNVCSLDPVVVLSA